MRPSELFRVLLHRALGGRSLRASPLAAVAAGGLAGWLTAGYLAAGLGSLPSRGVLAWLLVHYDAAAVYCLGLFAALHLVAALADDLRTHWLIQYLAAGGRRESYVLALAGAHTAGAALLCLLTVSAWLITATACGRPGALAPGTALLLLLGLPWLATPAAFAAAACTIAGSPGRALALMAATVTLPWLVLAAQQPSPEAGLPAWLPWAVLPAPPFPLVVAVRTLWFLVAYTATALALAAALAPRRLVRL